MKTLNTCIILFISSAVFTALIPTVSAEMFGGVRLGYYLPQGWSDTHDLIYGSGGDPDYGLELGYTFDFPLELAFAADFISGDGHRVWPDGNGGWETSGDSISYDLRFFTLVARWRFLRGETFSPYLGAGLGIAQFDESGEDSENGTGFLAQGGCDFMLNRLIHFYLEMEYSAYPNVIGDAGASRYFGEDDVGGFLTRLGVRFRF